MQKTENTDGNSDENTEQVVLIFDVETTGLNANRDQVLEFAFQKGLGAEAFRKCWRFKPTIPIPAAATAIHGIRDEDVATSPSFSSAIDTIRKIFNGSDVIVGYNVTFDIEMVQGELRRAGQEPLDLSEKCIVDPHRLWSRCEPRKLEDAVKRFAGREHIGAHSALADIEATGEVLTGMMQAFSLADKSWPELAEFIDPGKKNRIGGTEHISWQEGVLVFSFGKHRGRPVIEVIKEDDGYSRWLIGKDFPEHVKSIVSKASQLDVQEFNSWAASNFPCS